MEMEALLRWLHVIGACVLLGTGVGIAFFMVMAHRTRNAAFIAETASVVVIADFVFTATAVVAQPLTGLALAMLIGWPLTEGWLVISMTLYVATGLFWLPVVAIQIKLREFARRAVNDATDLPPAYHRLYRIWFLCGIPAFTAVLIILWMMLIKPDIPI